MLQHNHAPERSLLVYQKISHTRSGNKDLIRHSASKILGRYVTFHTLDLLDLLSGERLATPCFPSYMSVKRSLRSEGPSLWGRNKTIWISQPLPIPCSNSAPSVIKKHSSMVLKQSKCWQRENEGANELCMTCWCALTGGARKNPVWSKELELTDVWLWNTGQGYLNLKLLPLQGSYLWFMAANKWRTEVFFSQMRHRCHLLALEIS